MGMERDIYHRCEKFAEDVVDELRKFRPDYIDRVLVLQLVRSATSVAANMMEASESVSKKDFVNKLGISLKEAKESYYWLRLLSKHQPSLDALMTEASELVRILATIRRKYAVVFPIG